MTEREQNQRSFYRLLFPPRERPKLSIGHENYLVFELSEGGCRFLRQGSSLFEVGHVITGTLTFTSGKQEQVAGTIVRVDRRVYVSQFSQMISFHTMMELQRDLARRYFHFESSN